VWVDIDEHDQKSLIFAESDHVVAEFWVTVHETSVDALNAS